MTTRRLSLTVALTLATITGLVLIVAGTQLITGDLRVYNGANAGLAWDWGGVEFVGDPGVFLCEYDYDSQWRNPLAAVFPNAVVDC